MNELFDVGPPELKTVSRKVNPCVHLYGRGPERKTCKTCKHLYAQGGTSKRYLKCDLRRSTRGPATDHYAGWDACARYEEE